MVLKAIRLPGNFAFAYEHLPQETSVYRYRAGISASQVAL